jgi:hypothetical protein
VHAHLAHPRPAHAVRPPPWRETEAQEALLVVDVGRHAHPRARPAGGEGVGLALTLRVAVLEAFTAAWMVE